MKILKFLSSLLLSIVAYLLIPFVEITTFIIVAIKYKGQALDYFNKTWYKLDVISASRNRTLWNGLFVRKNFFWAVYFTKGTNKTISYHIWANYNAGTLTLFWYFSYYFLYAIDFTTWRKWGHCQDSVNYFNSLEKEKWN